MLDLSSLYLLNATLCIGLFALPFFVPGIQAQLRELNKELEGRLNKLKAQNQSPAFDGYDFESLNRKFQKVRHELNISSTKRGNLTPRLIHPHRFWFDNLLPVVSIYMVSGLIISSLPTGYFEESATPIDCLFITFIFLIFTLLLLLGISYWKRKRASKNYDTLTQRPKTRISVIIALLSLFVCYCCFAPLFGEASDSAGVVVPILFTTVGASVWTLLLWRAQYAPYSKLSEVAISAQQVSKTTSQIEAALTDVLLGGSMA